MTAAALAKAVTLLVLPLGDSITEGVPTEDGYRAALRSELARAGIEVKYAGSRRSPAGAHEGWSGYTTAELLPPLRKTLATVRPDVVLLHIGTNDLGVGVSIDEAVRNVRALLQIIDERSRAAPPAGKPAPRPIRVLLAKIIGRALSPDGRDDAVVAYNTRLEALAAERRKAGQPVEMVDMYAALDVRRDLADALHPNEDGYRKLARAWAAALTRPTVPK